MNDIIQHGSFFIYAILFVGFLVTLVSIERALSLYIRFRVNGAKLFSAIKLALAEGNSSEAIQECRKHGQNPLARTLEAGLTRIGKSSDEIQLSMEAEASYQVPRVMERLHFLPSFANLATLLGLVGTVVGLIKSFSAIGGQAIAGLNKGQALAAGVSESMYATAAGLVVAIPAIFVHLILAARAHRLVDEIDHYGLELKKSLLHPTKAQESTFQEASQVTRDLKITEEQSIPAPLKSLRPPFQEKSNAAAAKLALAVQQVTRENMVAEPTEVVAEEIKRLSHIEFMKKVSEVAHAGAVNAMEEVSENRQTHPLTMIEEKKI